MSGENWLAIAIVAPIAVAMLIPFTRWSLRVLAKAIVTEINGQLGIPELRADVSDLKKIALTNQEDVRGLSIADRNMQQQLERLVNERA